MIASADPAAMFKDPAKYAELHRRVASASAANAHGGVAVGDRDGGSGSAVGGTTGSLHKAQFALDGDDLEDDEEHLLLYYYNHLATNRGGSAGAGAGALSYATFRSQYRAAFLDLCRVVLASWWNIPGNHRPDPSCRNPPPPTIVEVLKARQAMPDKEKMVYNACNKNLQLACWMLRRMRSYLDEEP